MNPVPTFPNAALVRTDGAAAVSGGTILPPAAPNGAQGGGSFTALLRGLSLSGVEDAGMRQPHLGRTSASPEVTKLGAGGQSAAIAPTPAEAAIAEETFEPMVGHPVSPLEPSEDHYALQPVPTGELPAQEGDLEVDEGEHPASLPPSIIPDHTGPITPSPGLAAYPASLAPSGDGSPPSSQRPSVAAVPVDAAAAQAALAASGNFRTVETAINDALNAFGAHSRYVDAQVTYNKERMDRGPAAPAAAPSTELPVLPDGDGPGPLAAPPHAVVATAADHSFASVPTGTGSAEEGPTRATPRLSRGALAHSPPASPSLAGLPPEPAVPPPADAAVPVDLPSEAPDAQPPALSTSRLASPSVTVLATARHGPEGPNAAMEASSLPDVGATSAVSGATTTGLVAAAPETSSAPGLAAPHAESMPLTRQLAPRIVALSLKAGGAEGSSPGRIELLLEPAELGRVEIRVEPGAGPTDTTAVRILAERPETLALLQRDARELDRALNQAGLGADTSTGSGGFTLSFALGSGARQGGDGEGSGSGAGASSGLRRRVIAAGNVTGTTAPAVRSHGGPALALLDIAV